MSKERKNILAFCFVNDEKGAIPVEKFLELKHWKQAHCGLTNIPHMENVYGLYYNETLSYQGIIRSEDSDDICLSSIPKEEKQVAILYFNKNGYSTHCKDYRAYWDWVSKRNEARYENTTSEGKNYDAKNMMHTFRLLDMAIEIGRGQQINVRRPNRSFLLDIKSGKFQYETLLALAEAKQQEMKEAFEHATLPLKPDLEWINQLTFEIREELYRRAPFG